MKALSITTFKIPIVFEIFKVIFECSKSVQRRFFWSTFLTILTVGLNIITPIFFKNVIESLSITEVHIRVDYAMYFLGIYALSWMISKASMSLRLFLGYRVIESVSGHIITKILEKYLKQSLSTYVKGSVGKSFAIIEKIQAAVPKIFWGYTFYILPMTLEITGAFCVILYLYGYNYAITLVSFIFVYILYTLSASQAAVIKLKAANKFHSDAYKWLYDVMSNLEYIKCLGNTEFFQNKFEKKISKRVIETSKSRERMESIHLFQSLFLGICLFLMLYLSIRDFQNGVLNLSDVVLLNSYLLQFVAPLNTLGNIARGIREGKAAISELKEYLGVLRPEFQGGIFEVQTGNIGFDAVCYSYDSGSRSLDNVSFEIPRGKITAIVGETGSGKSTIFKQILRLGTPQSGQITMDGLDIQKINLKTYRSLYSVVHQNTHMFNMSIEENILLGKEINQQRLDKLTYALKLNKLLNRSSGSASENVGEKGLKLSGGEKQRLSILRALLYDAPILLLDEPTSSLDPLTEKSVLDLIKGYRGDKTIIIITHKAQASEMADKIIVMNEGRVEAEGEYETLRFKSQYFLDFVEYSTSSWVRTSQ